MQPEKAQGQDADALDRLGENHAGRGLGYLCCPLDRDADLGLLQGGRIVDAIIVKDSKALRASSNS